MTQTVTARARISAAGAARPLLRSRSKAQTQATTGASKLSMFHQSHHGIGVERNWGMVFVSEASWAAGSLRYECAPEGIVAEGILEAASDSDGIIRQPCGATLLVFHDEGFKRNSLRVSMIFGWKPFARPPSVRGSRRT